MAMSTLTRRNVSEPSNTTCPTSLRVISVNTNCTAFTNAMIPINAITAYQMKSPSRRLPSSTNTRGRMTIGLRDLAADVEESDKEPRHHTQQSRPPHHGERPGVATA